MQDSSRNGNGLGLGSLGTCVAIALAMLAAPAARAQLSADDIAALRAQGEREGWTFTVDANPATQYSLEQLCGVVEPPDWRTKGRFDPCTPLRDLPAHFDWREQAQVFPPIRNQGGCGSCWAFSVIGAVEPAVAIEDQMVVDLSEQWLVSCCGLGGCSGDWPGTAVNYLLCSGAYQDYCGGYGAVMEADFPYQGWDAPCTCPYPHPYCLTSWAYVGSPWGVPAVDQLKQAIYDHGPISVCVNATGTFQGYSGGVYNACDDSGINHAVVLVGWDDNGGNGYWYMRNSWGPAWGESGYMRITWGCCLIGYGALYVNYPGLPPTLVFSYPDGQPTEMGVNQPLTFPVTVTGKFDGVPVPNSGQLHYSLNNGNWTATAMTELSAGQYQATLPPAGCLDKYRWYVSAEEATSGVIDDPSDAPAHYYSTLAIAYRDPVFEDHFETDQGWMVQDINLAAGAWERGVPAGDGSRGDPMADYDGSGACFLTGNCLGDCDVDGGPTRLVSPAFDLSDGRPYQVGYARWFFNDNHDSDRLTVQLSNNGGANWVTVEDVPNVGMSWRYRSFNVGDYITPTANVKVQFVVSDNPNNSITEAAIDDFSVSALVCTPPHLGDLNCDGATDFGDIAPFVQALADPTGYAATYPDCPLANRDINLDGVFDFADINPFVALLTQ
jgi:C1A family cysteine protease